VPAADPAPGDHSCRGFARREPDGLALRPQKCVRFSVLSIAPTRYQRWP
jgi:hypothetical protein